MAFHDAARFPEDLSIGSGGGPGFSTIIISLESGNEQRVARREVPLRRYNVLYKDRTREQVARVVEFYLAREGALHGFRYSDCQDKTTGIDHIEEPTSTDNVLGVGDGATTIFQMVKTYENYGTIRTRALTKPVEGTSLISLNDVEVAEGVDWTIDATTGLVIMDQPLPADVVVKGGCQFDVPCRFDENADKLMSAAFIGGTVVELEDLGIVEILDGLTVNEDLNYGGAADITLTADIAVTPGTGRVLNFRCDVPRKIVRVPLPSTLTPGGPYFYIGGDAANTQPFQVEDLGGRAVVTIQPDTMYALLIDATPAWRAI